VVVGTIPLYVDQEYGVSVLLCRRNIEPRHGFWTLPAGFLENNGAQAFILRCIENYATLGLTGSTSAKTITSPC